jgi:Putative polyhydroxyalkanoic acid system protein (PHA_gran_rgn)
VSEPLVVIIPHQLGKEEALRRVKPALGKASQSFPILQADQEVWSGERMDFRVKAIGQVAVGNVQVSDTHVRLEVKMPWLLHKFATVVQKTIAGKGQILLENK